MRRKILLAFMSLLLVSGTMGMTACEKKNTNKEQTQSTSAEKKDHRPVQELLSSLAEQYDTIASMDQSFYGDEKWKKYFEHLYEASPDLVLDYGIYYSNEAKADEVNLLYAKSQEDVSLLKSKLEARIQSRIKTFESYLPEEVAKFDTAVIGSYDQYVYLIISDQSKEIEDSLLKTLK